MTVLVAAVSAGGVGTVLAGTLAKFFTRHHGKKVEFHVDGKLKVLHGYSSEDVDRIVKALQLDKNLNMLELLEVIDQILDDRTARDEDDPRPGDNNGDART